MSRQGGFTLLEVLVAAVLLAVMMGLLLGGMRAGADSWERGERLAERSARLLVVDNFLRSHLSDAKPLLELSDDPAQAGQTKLAFGGGRDWLEYAGALPPQVRGGLYVFRLRLERDGERSDVKLSMRPFAAGAQGKDAEPIEDVLVLEDVEGLRIAYYKKTPGEAAPEWVDEWREGFLPSLIRIDIELRGEPPWPSIFVAPRAEVG